MEEKFKPAKKTQYVDEMRELVVGTSPKPAEKVYELYFEYDPSYGNYTKRIPRPVVSKNYGEEQLEFEKSSEKFLGGRTKSKHPFLLERTLNEEIDWRYS